MFRKQKTMKQFSIFMLLLILSLPGFAEKVTLSGYLKDKANGEALIGASVYIPQLKTGVTSNVYGFFSISLPKGSYPVNFTYIGYQTQSPTIDLSESKQMNVLLEEDVKQIEEVVITGEKKDRNVESLQMSMDRLQVKMIKKLPSFMGEVDIIKSITLLPGIRNFLRPRSGCHQRCTGLQRRDPG